MMKSLSTTIFVFFFLFLSIIILFVSAETQQHSPKFPNFLRKAANEHSNILPLDSEISQEELTRRKDNLVSWLRTHAAAIEDDLKMTVEIPSLKRENSPELTLPPSFSSSTSPPKQTNNNEDEDDDSSSSSSSSPALKVPDYDNKNFVRLRFKSRKMMEPEEPFLILSRYSILDNFAICGGMDPRENATDYCEAAYWIANDRRHRFEPEHPQLYDADNKRKMEDQQMLMALFLMYVKFTPEDRREKLSTSKFFNQKHAFFGLPYIETFRHQPESPICSFNEKDIEFFPFENQLLRRRAVIREQWEYLTRVALPKFPKLFPGSDNPITMQGKIEREVFTFERFLWATCSVSARVRHVPGTGKLGFIPPIDLIHTVRSTKAINANVQKPQAATDILTVETKRYIAPGEEIIISVLGREESYPPSFLEYGILDQDESHSCALMEMPSNKTHDPLWNPCLGDYLHHVHAAGILPHRPENKIAYEACVLPSRLARIVDEMEKMSIYNKSYCAVDKMYRDKHQRRTPQTRFHAAQFWSLIVRGQMRRSSAKLARMDALIMKQKQLSKTNKQEVLPEIAASPNFYKIYQYSVLQKRLLTRIQTHLTQMMKDAKGNFQSWKDNEARKEQELEDARLIRLGLKEMDEQTDEFDESLSEVAASEELEEEEGDDGEGDEEQEMSS